MNELTERQQREIAYHVHHAQVVQPKQVTYDVLERVNQKWWNHYGSAYKILQQFDPHGKRALVPGCGEGFDAIVLAHLNAQVSAFDISPDMLALARDRTEGRHLRVDYQCMPAEQLVYATNYFDLIWVHDVLHHCDISRTLPELVRVAKPGAFILVDELYTHRFLQVLRESRFGQWIYPKLQPHIYRDGVYITEDERKLDNPELDLVRKFLTGVRCNYFNAVVNRFIPDWDAAQIADRVVMKTLGPAGSLVAGRFLLSGYITK